MDDDQVCPRCKTSKYRNPSMKLMVNVCGHPLCENCVNMLFSKGSGTCPQCDTPLRRSAFRVQLFEDAVVEKDVDIRRRILREFNKQQQDFVSLRDYNDYLEEVETIIHNLTNEVDVLATNKKIEAYKRDNKDNIVRNRSRARPQDEELEEILHVEQQLAAQRRDQQGVHVTSRQQRRTKQQQRREALIDELSVSYGDARSIVAGHVRAASDAADDDHVSPRQESGGASQLTTATSLPTCFSSGVRITGVGAASSSSQMSAPPPPPVGTMFVYEAPQLPLDGPPPPDERQLASLGYLAHIKAAGAADKAGGYRTEIGCMRALQDALAGLLYFPTVGDNVVMTTAAVEASNSADGS